VEYRRLGRSGLAVSEIGLGTNNFGTRLDQAQSSAVVDTAIELGINFFDTADLYGQGRSEELLGRAIGDHRKDLVIATKVGSPMGESAFRKGASRRWILQAVDESLKRLGTDWIDLYQIHTPDPETPILETIEALDDLVRSGKVRHAGTSNFAAWELVDADWTARDGQFARPIAAQYVWNLVEREVESTILAALRHLDVGLIVARPLAYGFLTGKFDNASDAGAGSRLPGSKRARDILTTANFDRLQSMTAFASDRGHSILELALGYLLSEPHVSSVIASASSPTQLRQNVSSSSWRLGPEDRLALEDLLPLISAGKPKS
jgi:aryl-alcohol dehydrogenase-like predicted oxidoreductase